MTELIRTNFFILMNKKSQEVTNNEMQQAYEDFITHVDAIGNENEFTNILRKLNFTRIEFQSLHTQFLYEQGKKCD